MSFSGVNVEHPFSWTFDGAMGFMNIGLFLFSGLTVFILNDFNRLVAVPLVTSALNALGAGFGYHAWNTGRSDQFIYSRQVTAVLCEVFYKFATLSLNLYSFFLLEKILVKGRRRTLFLSVYSVLFIALAAFCFSTIPFVLRFKTQPDNVQETGHLLDKLNYGDYITRAMLELWCAYFLLTTFNEARKGSRELGREGHSAFFRDLMRSSELRVSALVILTMIKLATYRTEENVGVVLSGIAQWEFATTNLFSVLFLIDVLAARMSKLQSSMASMMVDAGRPYGDNIGSGGSRSTGMKMISTVSSDADPIQHPSETHRRYIGKPNGKGAVDSLGEDFSHYGLTSWGGNRNDRTMSLPTQWETSEQYSPEGTNRAITVLDISRPISKDVARDIEKAAAMSERISEEKDRTWT